MVPNVLLYLWSIYTVKSVKASCLSLLSLYPQGLAQCLALWGSISAHLTYPDLAIAEINPFLMCI